MRFCTHSPLPEMLTVTAPATHCCGHGQRFLSEIVTVGLSWQLIRGTVFVLSGSRLEQEKLQSAQSPTLQADSVIYCETWSQSPTFSDFSFLLCETEVVSLPDQVASHLVAQKRTGTKLKKADQFCIFLTILSRVSILLPK